MPDLSDAELKAILDGATQPIVAIKPSPRDKGNFAGVRPELMSAYEAAQKELAGKGISLYTASDVAAKRDLAQQARLRQRYEAGNGNLAAPPTPNAPHVAGRALDLRADGASISHPSVRSVLESHGLRNTVPGEPWHWEVGGAAASPAQPRTLSDAELKSILGIAPTTPQSVPAPPRALGGNSPRDASGKIMRIAGVPVPVDVNPNETRTVSLNGKPITGKFETVVKTYIQQGQPPDESVRKARLTWLNLPRQDAQPAPPIGAADYPALARGQFTPGAAVKGARPGELRMPSKEYFAKTKGAREAQSPLANAILPNPPATVIRPGENAQTAMIRARREKAKYLTPGIEFASGFIAPNTMRMIAETPEKINDGPALEKAVVADYIAWQTGKRVAEGLSGAGLNPAEMNAFQKALGKWGATLDGKAKGAIAKAMARVFSPANVAGHFGGGAGAQAVMDLPEKLTPEERLKRSVQGGVAATVIGSALHGVSEIPRVRAELEHPARAATMLENAQRLNQAAQRTQPTTTIEAPPRLRRRRPVVEPKVQPGVPEARPAEPAPMREPEAALSGRFSISKSGKVRLRDERKPVPQQDIEDVADLLAVADKERYPHSARDENAASAHARLGQERTEKALNLMEDQDASAAAHAILDRRRAELETGRAKEEAAVQRELKQSDSGPVATLGRVRVAGDPTPEGHRRLPMLGEGDSVSAHGEADSFTKADLDTLYNHLNTPGRSGKKYKLAGSEYDLKSLIYDAKTVPNDAFAMDAARAAQSERRSAGVSQTTLPEIPEGPSLRAKTQAEKAATRAELDAALKEFSNKLGGKLYSGIAPDPEVIASGVKVARALVRHGYATAKDLHAALREHFAGHSDAFYGKIVSQFEKEDGQLPGGVTTTDPNEIAGKTFYHGTGTPDIQKPDPSMSDHEALFGTGLYLTDNPEIARGYAKNRGRRTGTPTLYEAKINPKKVLDLEQPTTPEAKSVFQKVQSQRSEGDYSDNLHEALAKKNATTEDLFKALREDIAEESQSEGIHTGEFTEVFEDLGVALRDAGYDAVTHTGGRRTNKPPHQVVILLPKVKIETAPSGAKVRSLEYPGIKGFKGAPVETAPQSESPKERPAAPTKAAGEAVAKPSTPPIEPPQTPPPAAKATTPPPAPNKYIGSINTEKLPEPILPLVKELYDEGKSTLDPHRRNVRSWADTEASATDLIKKGEIHPDQFINPKTGKAYNAEEGRAIAILHTRALEDLQAAKTRVLTDHTPEALNDLAMATARAQAVTAGAQGASAEAGRALNIYRRFRQAYTDAIPDQAAAKALIETFDPDKAPQPKSPLEKGKRIVDAPEFGTGNQFFTKDRAEAARKRLYEKLGRLNAGVDPALYGDLAEIGGFYVEGGIRKFADWAKQMKADFADLDDEDTKAIWGRIKGEVSGRAKAKALEESRKEAMSPQAAFEKKIRRILKDEGLDEGLLDKVRQTNDPRELQDLVRNSIQYSPSDKFFSAYRSSLLTGPATHLRNTVGNAIQAAMTGTSRAVAGLVDVPLAALTGRERAFGAKDSLAGVLGYLQGFPQGLKSAREIFQHGYTLEQANKLDLPLDYQQKGILKGLNYVGRGLGAADAIWRTMAFEGERAALAARKALNEGTGKAGMEAAMQNPELISQAEKTAARTVYQEDPAPLIRKIMDARSKHPWLNLVIPFLQTPANIVRETWRMSPAGILRLKSAVNKGGIDISDPEAARVISDALVGTSIITALSAFVNGTDITAGAPNDAAARDAFYRSGRQPYSFRAGNKWVSYQSWGPLTTYIATVAAWKDDYWRKKETTPIDAFLRTAGEIGKSMTEQSFLSGIESLIKVATDPEQNAAKIGARTAFGAVPYSGAIRSAAQVVDPSLRKTEGFAQEIQNNIPFASQALEPRIDALGREVKRYPRGIGALQPFVRGNVDEDVVSNELTRLGIFPGLTGKKLKVGNQDIELDQKTRTLYQRTIGKAIYEAAKRPLSSKAFLALPDDKKKDILEQVIDARRKGALAAFRAQLYLSQRKATAAPR